jgi:hypothetical protein
MGESVKRIHDRKKARKNDKTFRATWKKDYSIDRLCLNVKFLQHKATLSKSIEVKEGIYKIIIKKHT